MTRQRREPGDIVLQVEHVSKTFRGRRSPFSKPSETRAAVDVSFTVRQRETVALVGESGSGKTTVSRLALRLLDADAGSIRFEGSDITSWGEARLRPLRARMTMIFQDPYTSLNPRHTVATIIRRVLRWHRKPADDATIARLLDQVGLDPELMNRYPHQFSGGQRQRVGIARALATRPALVIADEPVSALDVSVRAQILNLLADLRDDHDLALLVVAHDLAVVRAIADQVLVMYLGTIVEQGAAAEVYASPQHPYTQALLSAVPLPDPHARRGRTATAGETDTATPGPDQCPFAPRCPRVRERCRAERPPLDDVAAGEGTHAHRAACFYPGPGASPGQQSAAPHGNEDGRLLP